MTTTLIPVTCFTGFLGMRNLSSRITSPDSELDTLRCSELIGLVSSWN